MRLAVGFCSMMIWFVGGSVAGSEPFTYHQDFDLDPAKFVRRDGRIEGDDIRVEGRLSSENLRSWKLVEGGVAVGGSRRDELLRRENLIRDKYNGANISYVTIRGYRVPWLTLSLGDLDWVDYRVRATVRPGEKCSAGVAFRFQNARQYYAFVLEDQGKASLVLRRHDREAKLGREAWDRLKVVALDVKAGQTYELEVAVDGAHITCSVDGQQLIEFDDLTLRSGKVALLSDNPAFFGPVSVEGTLVRPELPPLPKCAGVRRLHQIDLPVAGRQQYFFLDVDSDGEREIITAGEDGDGYTWRCFEFDGTEMWKISGIEHPTTEGGDRPMQVFDINGDGKNEVVLAADFEIQVRDGATGELLRSVPTPKPNPYYDSRDYPHPRLLGDSICPIRLTASDPPGFYIKDRYTNIWVFNHRLELQWQKALSTGHFPMPVDHDGDGDEELQLGFHLFNPDGSTAWALPLNDHVDCPAYASLDPGKKPARFYLAAGESGLLEIDAESGWLLNRYETGHVQFVRIADFLPERPGLELMTQTSWREDQLHYLYDKDLILLSSWQAPTGITNMVPWGEGGHDLLLTTSGIRDALTGRKVGNPIHGYKMVVDDPRWGNGVVFAASRGTVQVFGPEEGFVAPPRNRPYLDIQSNYMSKVALPIGE